MKKQVIKVVGSVITVEYPTIGKSLSLDTAKLNPDVREAMLIHGGCQKLGDAKSGGTPMEKFEMATRIKTSLEAGSWTLSEREENFEAVIAAVAAVKGISVAKVRKALEALDEDAEEARLKEWRAHPKVKAEIAKARAAAAAKVAAESDDLSID